MEHFAAVLALIGVIGIGSQWVAWRTGLPAIALMLVTGLLAGPIFGIINPEVDFGHLLEPLVSLAVAVILFEGGLSLNLRELRHVEGAVHRLVLIGVPVGWVLGALACYYIAGLVWPVAILFAGILVVTGPTVVIPLLRQTSVSSRTRAILKWEAIVNDPIGALCAVVTYEVLRQAGGGATIVQAGVSLLAAAVVAGLMGFGVARLLGWALPRGYIPEFLKAPVLLVAVIATFVGSNAIEQETGLLAVTVMGIAMANMGLASLRDVLRFKENMTVILVSGVFVLLSASLDLAVLRQFEFRFGLFILALLFLVRPATVFLSLLGSRIPWRERLFVGWIAPRGIVLVAITGLFALRLGELGFGDGGTLVALSFAVVAATILAHGFTIAPMARVLGLTSPGGSAVLVIGATEWGTALAGALQRLGVGVVISDTSPQRLAEARSRDIACFNGEILAEATEERLDLQQFGILAAVTDNEAYNTLVCSEFAPELGRDNVYQLGDETDDAGNSLPATLRGRAIFQSGFGVQELAHRIREDWVFASLKVDNPADYARRTSGMPQSGGPLLLIAKSGRARFFTHASRPTPGQGDTVLAYAPRPALQAAGWQLLHDQPARNPETSG
ncbi:NhaP-type Na+/H+ or K+/H+ antiporter [Sphingomonas kaistensis]|uniref:NhaP-type Na+/H+ or K+/H+ antiporter n=1 Tax=Sphingomonas kaistensis TaxID=298708 RepID=A0A7X5Y8L0_9SPHN|nr:sodium:proton antiporter [Sphingomonas kaistensis]NJC06840.1 NhaP-type Na+/H+ or K+/H+ antiporter [Sphingomonas kaistensis]